MIEGQQLYFSPAEFMVMMELGGVGRYCMLRIPGDEPNDAELTRAFLSLFQRGCIKQDGGEITLAGDGLVFAGIRKALGSVWLSTHYPCDFSAMCYVGETTCWLVEVVDDILLRRYRLRQTDCAAMKAWLLEGNLLERPTLTDEDVAELALLLKDELSKPQGEELLRIERRSDKSTLLCCYTMLEYGGSRMLSRADAQGRDTRLYTQEALADMLTECFGKESS